LQAIDETPSFLYGAMDPARLDGVWFQAVPPTRGWDQDYGWFRGAAGPLLTGSMPAVSAGDKKPWQANPV
jgi:hypothetical protein